MEIIYFLIFIAVCAFVVIWASRRTKSETNLPRTRTPRKARPTSDLLSTPAGHRLSRKEEIWATRRKHATKGFTEPQRFVPKFESKGQPEYDGYSRRDRHHLTKEGQVAEEAHIDEVEEISTTSIKFAPKQQSSQK